MKSFIFILGLLAFVQEKTLAASIEAEEVIDEEWESFKLKFNKSYDSNADELFRRKVFMENKRIIAEHNARYYEGKHNFTLKMNHFGDMLRNEYSSKFIWQFFTELEFGWPTEVNFSRTKRPPNFICC